MPTSRVATSLRQRLPDLRWRLRVALACALLLPGLAAAQAFPNKPVKLVVPFAAGSATDVVARLLAQALTERTQGIFVVENRAGANGAIAAESVAKAAPDGYTLFAATVSTHSQNPWLFKKLPYDALNDFVPIASVGGFPFVIVVRPESSARTLGEFIERAKASPGKLSYGAPGGTQTICAETLKQRASIELISVPYKGAPQAVSELMGGQIDMICADFATAIGAIKGGKLRALAVTTATRAAQLPDVPTIAEVLPGFVEMRSWIGLLAPKGAPTDAIDWLGHEILAVTAAPAFAARLDAFGFKRIALSGKPFAQFMKTEFDQWEMLIKRAGMEPQ